MSDFKNIFHQIIDELSDEAKEGKMFGATCIKTLKGKVAAVFWEDNMMFKLDEQSQEDALKIEGAKIGAHLYAPERPMKGWITIPKKHSEEWKKFTKKAIAFLNK